MKTNVKKRKNHHRSYCMKKKSYSSTLMHGDYLLFFLLTKKKKMSLFFLSMGNLILIDLMTAMLTCTRLDQNDKSNRRLFFLNKDLDVTSLLSIIDQLFRPMKIVRLLLSFFSSSIFIYILDFILMSS